MIYLVDEEMFIKIRELRIKYHLNVSSLIRDFLDSKHSELKKDIREK